MDEAVETVTDERPVAPERPLLRPVQRTTLARMRATAAAEAGRIEIVQTWLVTTGQREEPAEQQLALRDDYDAMVRLIDAVEALPDIKKRLVEMLRR
jgi:hypothetical protein